MKKSKKTKIKRKRERDQIDNRLGNPSAAALRWRHLLLRQHEPEKEDDENKTPLILFEIRN